jgi:hypothetical protein
MLHHTVLVLKKNHFHVSDVFCINVTPHCVGAEKEPFPVPLILALG